MVDLVYSLATQQDIAFISETYTENIKQLHGTMRSMDDWQALLTRKEHTYYIVKAESPVAWFRIDLEDGGFWLGMLQVKPACQRMGIGRYVLAAIESMARETGYTKVGIHTTEDNLPARALYRSAGYRVTEIGPCTTADGVDRVGYTFHKEL